jgi:hypothetical protein
VLLFELIKDLITLVVYLLKRGYGIGEKAAYATRNGYRSFAQGVENMNQSYLSFKSRILKRLSPK